MPIDRQVNVLAVKQIKEEVLIAFQDVDNRQSLDLRLLWENPLEGDITAEALLTLVKNAIPEMKKKLALPVPQGQKRDKPVVKIQFPARTKDEKDEWLCLYLNDAERLVERLQRLFEQRQQQSKMLCRDEEKSKGELYGEHDT